MAGQVTPLEDDPRLVALGLAGPAAAAAPAPVAPALQEPPQVAPARVAPAEPDRPRAAAPPPDPIKRTPTAPPPDPIKRTPDAPPRRARSLPPPAEEMLGARTDGLTVPVFAGFPARPGVLTFDAFGVHVTGKEPFGVAWSAVTELATRRGQVLIRTAGRRIVLAVAVDGIAEPDLAGRLARLLLEARAGSLDRSGSAILEFRNAADRLRDQFHDEDDLFTPAVIGIVLAAAAVACVMMAPHLLTLGASPAVLGGIFVIDSRISPFDPRSLLTGIAAAAMLTSLIVRVASKGQSVSWARGVLRGWHRGRPVPTLAYLVLATVVARPAVAAAVLLLGATLALPSARTLVVFDGAGVKVVRELPFLDEERPWQAVVDITAIPAPLDRHPSGVAVVVRFADGASITTLGNYLRGGTDRQFLDVARTWREAATERRNH